MRKYIKFTLTIIILLFIFSPGIKSEIVKISDNIYSKDPYVLPFDNKVMVMWAEKVSGNFDLYYRICSGGAWGPKTRFNTGIYNSIFPQLELAPDGKVHAVWMGKMGEARSIYHAYYTNGVWSTPEEVYPSTRRSCWPRLGILSNGILCSIWTQSIGSGDQNSIYGTFKAFSSWVGGGFTNTPNTTSIHADLYARSDKAYACWMDHEGDYYWNLWFSQKQWGGYWTTPAIVVLHYAQWPAIAVDSKGDVHIIFYGGGGNTPYYINRVNGTWSGPVQLPYLGKFTKNFVYLDVDKWDYLHAVWRQQHNATDDIGYVIRDEQGSWGTPEYVSNSSTATGFGASKPLVRVDNNGYAHIVWLDRRSESVQDEGKIFYNSVQYKADPQTLNVYSAPFFEVPITVSPVDINGHGDDNTNFTRTYDENTSVTLTAPEIFNGKNFERWIIDETNDFSRTINVTMNNEHSVVAIYQTDDIIVMSPNGGENWEAYTIQNIYWLTPGTVTDVKIEYSIDNGTGWNDVVASTVNDGIYEWTVPDTPSTQCLIKISDISGGIPPDTSDSVFTITQASIPSEISLSRNSLCFGTNNSKTTQSQSFLISNAGGGTLTWTVLDDMSWLSCSPPSGTDTGKVTCTVDPSGLSVGTYNGTVTVTDPNAVNSPQTISVTLKVYNEGSTSAPFGLFDTPINNSDVFGSVPVTGWALDDIEVETVLIKREPVASDAPGVIGADGLVLIGSAVFVEGARPDVEAAYPTYPLNYRAGWGYMLLTNALPDGGNGTFVLHAKAYDKDGHKVDLGTKTINVDNASSVMPFGAIDTPHQGGEASGASFVNFGWALTPVPNTIVNGTTSVDVLIDSIIVGNATYGDYRSDIEAKYPGYNNSGGAGGHFYIDTTAYENCVHTISWHVRDDASHVSGIGSRFFSIINTGTTGTSSVSLTKAIMGNRDRSLPVGTIHELSGYIEDMEPILVSWGLEVDCELIYPDMEHGVFKLNTREVEQVVVHLGREERNEIQQYQGYVRFGNELRRLPIGSTLDNQRGIFYWEPGPGFIGEYELIFIDKINKIRKNIKILIKPKFERIVE